jgi:hypothetical protein
MFERYYINAIKLMYYKPGLRVLKGREGFKGGV